jgi:serine/threonine protein kinase
MNIILSYLDEKSMGALVQTHPQIKHYFHIRDTVYYQSLQDRFPTLYEGAKVGRGACGTVYKVEDWKQDSMKVAVKVCEKSAVHSYTSWRKLFGEISIMRGNDHVNVSRLYEVFQTPTQLVMVVELGEGGSLKRGCEVIKRKGLDMEVFTANVVAQVAAGLDYLYSVRKLVHRDIKQDNIVLSKDFSRVMIIDFGLAEYVRNEKSQRYVPCGTMGFASPENILAVVERKTMFEATGLMMHASDIFSLGVMAYMMLSGGQKPLKGKFGEMHQDVKRGIKCLGRHWNGVSFNAKHLVEWLLIGPTLQRALPEDVVNHKFVVENVSKFTAIGDTMSTELNELERVEVNEWVFVANRMNISEEWLSVDVDSVGKAAAYEKEEA